MANAIDLTTLANIKNRFNITGTSDDALLAYLITSVSLIAMHEAGCGPMDWSIPEESPLVEPVEFDEFYDGNGSYRMFLRNQPINSVAALTINGRSFSQSTGYGAPGFVIDGSGKSISLRGGGAGQGGPFTFTGWPGWGAGYAFCKGIQNVEVQYTAGFASAPWDLQDKAEVAIGVNYRQAAKREQASIALAQGAGTTTFRDMDLPMDVKRVFQSYRRSALV